MAALYVNIDFFFPKEEEGNLSLSTLESRIHEVIQSLGSDDWVELDDGTRCTSEEELRCAIAPDKEKL